MSIVHFEVLADEPERAITFYASVFGWHIVKWQPDEQTAMRDYWLIHAGPEAHQIGGGLSKRTGERPQSGSPINAFVCTILVRSIDEALRLIPEYGGLVTRDKTRAGNAWVAYAQDTEGNNICIMQTATEEK